MVTPLTANRRASSWCNPLARTIAAALAFAIAAPAAAAPPKIRSDTDNNVPRCVTPKRLMAFLKTRNTSLDPRFADIASLYKKHGETWRVRWDYAFFQMAVETNFLTYRKGDGGWGDVNPKQNNFAGLGTTGGGVPGDSYPDVSTGVLAQIQHLVVYSGERIDSPVGARTRLKQDDIIETMASKKGNTTFADLSRRWAADRHYGASIEWVANSYRQMFCKGPDPVEEAELAPPKTAKRVTPQQFAQTANLGGPKPPASEPASKPPVRTIWSAADGPTAGNQPDAQSQSQPDPGKAKLAPLPKRKPAIEAEIASSPVLAEQVIQTGEDPVPTEEGAVPTTPEPQAAAIEPAVSTPPTQTDMAPRPGAFGYAAALGSALPQARPESPQATASTGGCSIATASYGGKKVLLVRTADATRFTVLSVLEGFEKSMLDSFLKAHAPGGSSLGEFASKDAALAKARELCPRAAGRPVVEGASAG